MVKSSQFSSVVTDSMADNQERQGRERAVVMEGQDGVEAVVAGCSSLSIVSDVEIGEFVFPEGQVVGGGSVGNSRTPAGCLELYASLRRCCFGVGGGGCWEWSLMPVVLVLIGAGNRGVRWLWEEVVDHDYGVWLLATYYVGGELWFLWGNRKNAKPLVQEFLMITYLWDPGPLLDLETDSQVCSRRLGMKRAIICSVGFSGQASRRVTSARLGE